MGWNSTLTRKTPMKRGNKPMKRSPFKQVSKKLAKAKQEYHPASRSFLSRPENTFCLICVCFKTGIDWNEAKALAKIYHNPIQAFGRLGVLPNPSTETHHQRGRIGSLLTDERFFIPCCRPCRSVPHDNPARARQLELLASPVEFNTVPR
jgi:hypothetical protein